MRPLNIGVDAARQKIQAYCAYQERCHYEVKEKLYTYGLYKPEVEQIIADLIEGGYLNEERFALLYAGGKFRMKQWGKAKIKQGLYQHQVSDYCIKKALASIDEGAYNKTLIKLANAKAATLRSEKNKFTKMAKIKNYLLQKGYESRLVLQTINSILANKN